MISDAVDWDRFKSPARKDHYSYGHHLENRVNAQLRDGIKLFEKMIHLNGSPILDLGCGIATGVWHSI